MAAGGMGFGWMGFDGALDGWKRKKSATPKKTAAIEAIEGIEAIERIALRGVWRGQGLFMVRHLEMAVCFAIMWGVAKWWWMVDFLEEC